MAHPGTDPVGRSALREVAWRLVPFLGLLCFVDHLDRTDAAGPAGDAEAGAMLRSFELGGVTWAAASTDPAEAEALFAARRLGYPALERLGPLLTGSGEVSPDGVPA